MKKSKKDYNILKNQNFWLSVFLVLIIGFGFYLYFQDKTEFIIYKQECEDLGKTCDKHCVDFCARVKLNDTENEKQDYFVNTYDRFWKCLNYNGCCENSCEVIEVDFMEIKDLCDYKFIRKGVNGVYAGSNNNHSWYECGSIYFKNINLSWLNDNCDVCHDYICISKSENTNISAIEFANEDLKFYQCGNYTIEVLK